MNLHLLSYQKRFLSRKHCTSCWKCVRHPSFCLFFSSVHSEYLDIWDVDMMRGKNEINKQQHHTVFYSSDYLIVRRGQEFQVKISFNRPYKPAEDKFAVEFVIGEQSTPSLNGQLV